MPAIARIVTPHQVYKLGRTLPVPAGYPIDPFIVAEITRTEEGFQLLCVPDTRDVADLQDMFQDAESVQIYAYMANKAHEDGIILMAEVPFTEDTRVETLMTRQEYDALPIEEEDDTEEASDPNLPGIPELDISHGG